jgi:hypothetical protein
LSRQRMNPAAPLSPPCTFWRWWRAHVEKFIVRLDFDYVVYLGTAGAVSETLLLTRFVPVRCYEHQNVYNAIKNIQLNLYTTTLYFSN